MNKQPTGLKKLAYRMLNGWSPFKFDLQVSITNRCNLKCWFCPVHSLSAEDNAMKRKSDLPDMDCSTLFKLIYGNIRKINTVHICGKGEPTLHPDFIFFCQYLDAKKVPFTVTTNGARLPEYIDRLSNMKFCKGIRLSVMKGLLYDTTGKYLECKKVSFFVYDSNIIETKRWIKAKVVSFPGIKGDTSGVTNVKSCVIPFNFAFIHSNGDVSPCCHSSLTLGNVTKQTLKQILNGIIARHLRKEAVNLNNNPLPQSDCKNCGHYAFDK